MKSVIFDIETAPMGPALAELVMPKFEPPANYKTAEAIANNLAKQKESWLESLALSPLTGTVCAIGISCEGEDKPQIALTAETTEAEVVAWFWNYFRDMETRSRFIGFNIAKFDLPFLVKRSWTLGVKIPVGVRSGRYWSDTFVDLMEIWQMGNRQEYISLDSLAKHLGVGSKSGNGKDFHKFTPEEQRAYLANDLNLTRLCAERMI